MINPQAHWPTISIAEKTALQNRIRNFTQLETKRLIIRPLTFDDVFDLERILSDPAINHWVSIYEKPFTTSAARRFIATAMDKQEAGEALFLGVFYKEVNVLMGEINCEFFPDYGVGDPGCSLEKVYWGKGFTAEAGICWLDFLFSVGTKMLYVTHKPDNRSSQRLTEFLGFKRKGEADVPVKEGGSRLSPYYEMTADEWQTARPTWLQLENVGDEEIFGIDVDDGKPKRLPPNTDYMALYRAFKRRQILR